MKGKKVLSIVALSLVGVLILGSGAVYASDNAKPGDILYPVDRFGEEVQKLLVFGDSSKAELEIEMYDERVKELNELDNEDSDDMEMEIESEKDIKGLDVAIENFYEQYERVQEKMDALKEKYENGELTQEQYEKLLSKLSEISEKHKERINKMVENQDRIEEKIQEKREVQEQEKEQEQEKGKDNKSNDNGKNSDSDDNKSGSDSDSSTSNENKNRNQNDDSEDEPENEVEDEDKDESDDSSDDESEGNSLK